MNARDVLFWRKLQTHEHESRSSSYSFLHISQFYDLYTEHSCLSFLTFVRSVIRDDTRSSDIHQDLANNSRKKTRVVKLPFLELRYRKRKSALHPLLRVLNSETRTIFYRVAVLQIILTRRNVPHQLSRSIWSSSRSRHFQRSRVIFHRSLLVTSSFHRITSRYTSISRTIVYEFSVFVILQFNKWTTSHKITEFIILNRKRTASELKKRFQKNV